VDAVDIQLQQQRLLAGRQQVSALLADAHIGWVDPNAMSDDDFEKNVCTRYRPKLLHPQSMLQPAEV
jgi:hypothetical protein